jgi:hypothetical protein
VDRQPIRIEYPYRANWLFLAVAAPGLAALSFYCGRAAATSRTGLVIDGISLSPHGAAILHTVVCAIAAFSALVLAVMLVERFTVSKTLVLTDDTLMLPRGMFSAEHDVIPYAAITSLHECRGHGVDVLHIYTATGHHRLDPTMLPSRTDFLDVLRVLQAHRR